MFPQTGKMSVDFPVCHCRGEIWRGSGILSEIKIQPRCSKPRRGSSDHRGEKNWESFSQDIREFVVGQRFIFPRKIGGGGQMSPGLNRKCWTFLLLCLKTLPIINPILKLSTVGAKGKNINIYTCTEELGVRLSKWEEAGDVSACLARSRCSKGR